jgi:VanZ family protein
VPRQPFSPPPQLPSPATGEGWGEGSKRAGGLNGYVPSLMLAARLGLIAALAAVTWLSLGSAPLPLPGHSDKLAHACAFLGLGWLADFAFPGRPYGMAKILPLLAYGLGIELAQAFQPGRVASAADWLADAAGLALYPLAVPLLRRVPIVRRRWGDTRADARD